jgi:hypothetical protein
MNEQEKTNQFICACVSQGMSNSQRGGLELFCLCSIYNKEHFSRSNETKGKDLESLEPANSGKANLWECKGVDTGQLLRVVMWNPQLLAVGGV